MKHRSAHKFYWFGIGALLLQFLSTTLFVPVSSSLAVGQAQTRQLQRQSDPVNAWPNKAKRWALVIGVDKYRDQQIGALKGSENDARTVADALVRYAGFPSDQVILLSTDQPEERQPTRVNILRRLSNLTSVVPKDGLLLISFAGHGMERNGQAYLLPSDAQISEDISFLEETALSVMRMKEKIRATGVTQVVILLDACRNDPGGRAGAPNLLSTAYTRAFNFDVKNREVQAFATIYATAVGQRAYEYSERRQGYFTWAIVEGLKGAAANEKGEVTLAALVDYVQNTVPKRIGIDLGGNKQQRPFAMVEGYKADQLVIAVAGAAAAPSAETVTRAGEVDSSALEMSFWETIKNSTDPGDFQAYLDRFPNGTFAALAQRRATPNNRPLRNETSASGSPGAAIGNVDEALAQAERDLKDEDYEKATSVARAVLATNPAQPKANLLMGLVYLRMKKYTNSANYLSKAVSLGEQVDIPVQHHHDIFMIGDALCAGYLRVGNGMIEFHSSTAQKDDFSVPVARVLEMTTDPGGGGRVRMKIGIDKGGKIDKRNLAFHPLDAYIGKKTGSSLVWIFCDNCLANAQAMSQLLQQLIKASSATQEISATGSAPGATSLSTPSSSQAKEVGSSPAANSVSNESLLKELLDWEQRVFEAFQRGDKAVVSAMMVDEAVQVQDGKSYSKERLLSMVKPQQVKMVLSYESVSVSFQGDNAVLTGIAIFRAQSGTAMVTIRQKFTDVFVKRGDRWMGLKSDVTTLK